MILIILLLLVFIFFRLKHNDFLSTIPRIFMICTVLFFVVSIVYYPKEAVESAKHGVDMWFNIVLPSLLPFFIGAELLIRLGVVNFIGSILEPIIRPVFNVPGEGSFVFAMSLTSGYPVGVKLVSKLRNEGVFTKEEGQRVMSFASTSGPLFMLGAVAIGMFHSVELGIIVILAHYLGAIVTGILFRFYKWNPRSPLSHPHRKYNIFSAFKLLIDNKHRQRPPFGKLLGESVKEAIETILVVGGFIILFSVIIKILSISGIIRLFSNLLLPLWKWLGFNQEVQYGIVSGIFEITVGCKLISEVQNIAFVQQAIIATMIISWSGLSIIAQAASMIHSTDLSVSIYIGSKLLHAVFSGFFAFLLAPFYHLAIGRLHIPVFHYSHSLVTISPWIDKFAFSTQFFVVISITLMIICILLSSIFNKYLTFFSIKK